MHYPALIAGWLDCSGSICSVTCKDVFISLVEDVSVTCQLVHLLDSEPDTKVIAEHMDTGDASCKAISPFVQHVFSSAASYP